MFVIKRSKLSHVVICIFFCELICLLSIFLCDFIKLYEVFVNINNVYITDMIPVIFVEHFLYLFLWGE